VVYEKDTEEIPGLPLIPIRSPEYTRSARDMVRLPRISLDPNPPRMFDTQQMIHHFESFVPLRKVNSTDVDNTLELTLRVIT